MFFISSPKLNTGFKVAIYTNLPVAAKPGIIAWILTSEPD
jgi:hypothetical protein